MPVAVMFFESPGTALIAVGAVMLYVASRAAADALAGGDAERPGLRALGHCLPIAAVALMCLYPGIARPGGEGGRPQVAVGLVFATSVSCLSLVLGIVTYLAPVVDFPPSRRAWPFVLPAALLALVAGFNGELTWIHAGMLAMLGFVVMNLWLGAGQLEGGSVPFATTSAAPSEPDARRDWKRWLQLGLAFAVAGVGGWAAARGAARLELSSRLFSGALIAGTVLSPLLTLPVLGTTARLAERGHAGSAVATLVAMALINLCLVLPLVIVANYAATGTAEPSAMATAASPPESTGLFSTLRDFGQPTPYPLVSWRIDSVVLAVLGFALIPWAIGRWTLARAESASLIFGYAIYLALVAFLSSRWR